MSILLNEVAWAIEAKSGGEPICRDVPPEPYFLEMARAALEGLMNCPPARTALSNDLYTEILALTAACGRVEDGE